LIADLENVRARQWGQPGGVSLADDAVVKDLIRCGDAAVEPLLDCLENDTRLTRSVHFWRDFAHRRSLLGVHEAAYVALSGILQTSFFSTGSTGDDLSARGMEGRKEVAASVRAYWKEFAGVPLEERWYLTLRNDGASPAAWLQAAANIARPIDVQIEPSSMLGGWVKVPQRAPGCEPPLAGEKLRPRRDPGVTSLMTDRIERLTWSGPPRSSDDMFTMHQACTLALCLAKWDPVAARPVLRKTIAACHTLMSLRWNGNDWTSQILGRYSALMTIACAASLARMRRAFRMAM
jgi:hypothetical protein